MKNVLVLGILSLIFSMTFLALSHWFFEGQIDFYLVLWGTAFIGGGFGFGITALNPFAHNLFPGKETSAITAMHIMLGLGTASSALLLSTFLEFMAWWLAPALVAVLSILLLILIVSTQMDLNIGEDDRSTTKKKVPTKIWLFAFGVFLYGACEATFGNFGSVFLESEKGLTMGAASLGLSIFWAAITIGRLLFTIVALRYKTENLFILAPFLVGLIFLLIPSANTQSILLAYMVLGGLGLSFLFPKSISLATDEFPAHGALISGVMVAAIQLGTGISSNVIGSLNMTFDMGSLFRFSSVYAFSFGILLIILIKLK